MDSSRSRLAAGALLACVALGCGKHRVDPIAEAEGQRWDPPTPAFGFHPAARVECMPEPPSDAIPQANELRREEITRPMSTPRHLAADRSAVYWTENEGARGSVYSASRVGSVGRFEARPIATDEVDPDDVAVADDGVYWTSGEQTGSVRFFDKSTQAIGTLAVEGSRPERLVAEAESVFWIAAPNHLREAHVAWGSKAPIEVRTLLTITLMPALLAVDARAVYAFTNDHTLVRVGRDGSRPIVLVSTTGTAPVDLAVDGPWVYWLEAGPTIETCTKDGVAPCRSSGYEMKETRSRHPAGSLHRVRTSGGPVEDLAAKLPNVEKLAFLPGVAWITTERGLLRVPTAPGDSSEARENVTLEPMRGVHARFATIGDALVLGTDALAVQATGGYGPAIVLAAPP